MPAAEADTDLVVAADTKQASINFKNGTNSKENSDKIIAATSRLAATGVIRGGSGNPLRIAKIQVRRR